MTTSTNTLEQALEIDLLERKTKNFHQKVAYLKEQLAWFQRQIFGKRSEKIVV